MEGLSKETHNYIKSITASKFIKLFYALDEQISKNFKFESIATRPVKSNGLWCFILTPAVLLLYTFLYNVSPVYKLVAYLSVGLISYSIMFIAFLYMSCLVLKGSYTSGCTFAVFMATLPVHIGLGYDLHISLAFSTILVLSYSFFLKKCLLNCPRTFTVGEAMVVSQGISLALTASVITFYSYQYWPEFQDDDDTKLIKSYVITVLSTVGLLVTEFLTMPECRRNKKWLALTICIGAFGVLTALFWALGPLFLHRFFGFVLFRSFLRIKLFLFWLWLVLTTVVVLVYRGRTRVKATTVTRKSFHLLASVVFASGILLDLEFIALAAGIIFGVTLFIEGLRLARIEPISPALQTAFEVYSDEKDVGMFAMTPIYLYVGLACPLALVPWREGAELELLSGVLAVGRGMFAMTPIYLYVGLACPLALVPWREGAELELLSGVLAVGIGDTAASYFGQKYGCLKWPGSNRSLEGTLANMVSQIVVVCFLRVLGLLPAPSSAALLLLRASIAAVASGVAEAQMEQVDNVMLPLISILSLQFAAFLYI
ncbi:dolichol kinase isoform X1 [Phthorimaea operculella]|nr:dolichol kinase isoform X1 [Phthorimaea operculella]